MHNKKPRFREGRPRATRDGGACGKWAASNPFHQGNWHPAFCSTFHSCGQVLKWNLKKSEAKEDKLYHFPELMRLQEKAVTSVLRPA